MASGFGQHSMPPPASDPDLLTLKLVCKSHLRWGTFLPNLNMLGLWILEVFTMYATADRQTDKSNAYCPLPYSRGYHNDNSLIQVIRIATATFSYCCTWCSFLVFQSDFFQRNQTVSQLTLAFKHRRISSLYHTNINRTASNTTSWNYCDSNG